VASETLGALGRGGRPVNVEELFARVMLDNFGVAPPLSAPWVGHQSCGSGCTLSLMIV
jgi:hypothetical protein